MLPRNKKGRLQDQINASRRAPSRGLGASQCAPFCSWCLRPIRAQRRLVCAGWSYDCRQSFIVGVSVPREQPLLHRGACATHHHGGAYPGYPHCRGHHRRPTWPAPAASRPKRQAEWRVWGSHGLATPPTPPDRAAPTDGRWRRRTCKSPAALRNSLSSASGSPAAGAGPATAPIEGFSWEEMADEQELLKMLQNQKKPWKLRNLTKLPKLRNQTKPRCKNKTWFQTKQTWRCCWHRLWRSWYNVHQRRKKLQKQKKACKLRNQRGLIAKTKLNSKLMCSLNDTDWTKTEKQASWRTTCRFSKPEKENHHIGCLHWTRCILLRRPRRTRQPPNFE